MSFLIRKQRRDSTECASMRRNAGEQREGGKIRMQIQIFAITTELRMAVVQTFPDWWAV